MSRTIPFAIIGAGPAGLAAAIAYGPGAVITERNREAGVKLLLSGSGQCNFTNKLGRDDFIRACRKAGPFLKPAFYAFDSRFFIELLEKNGCPSLAREDGKVFPASLKASDVRDALLQAALGQGARIMYGVQVLSVQKTELGFALKTGKGDILCWKLLLACGGASWPQTGSSGDGYSFAKELGHAISPLRPALASIETEGYGPFRTCAGNTLYNIKAEFITAQGKHKGSGDVLFTHRGLSGPLILDNSHLLEKGAVVRLHLLPEAEPAVNTILQSSPSKQVSNALKALALPSALLEAVLRSLQVKLETPAGKITRQERNRISSALQAWDFKVKAVESLRTCMSTAGGVALKEVNSAAMESRLVKGLYLAGEVLDHALPTGGFNIQIAFSTGWLAGKSALG